MPIEGIKNISQLAQAFASERTPGNDQATAEALAYRLAILVSVKPIGSHPPACRAGAEGEGRMMDILSSISLPYWLMIAGAALVAVGFLGLFVRNRQTDDSPEPVAPRPKMPPLPTLLDSSRGKGDK